MTDFIPFIIQRMNYFVYILLMLLGMYGVFYKKNYMKKIIGLNILQTAIILFFYIHWRQTGCHTAHSSPFRGSPGSDKSRGLY